MLQKIFNRILTSQGRKDIKFAVARKMINPWLRHLGYTLIADHFYQPIPNLQEMKAFASQERPIKSIEWDIPEQARRTQDLLSLYKIEFNNKQILSQFGYSKNTSALLSGDAEVLYSVVRNRKPNLVIEIGSGGSTQIITSALKMNFLETGKKPTLISIEPYPQEFLQELESFFSTTEYLSFNLLQKKVQDLDLSIFKQLQKNDILFVDSSHVFKVNSDVEYEFLKIYPFLNKDVLVHIHDIFFPYDYPLEWNLHDSRYWNEQYFLEVFLQFNTKFHVLFSLSMISYYDNSIFLELIDAYDKSRLPGSFWMISVN